MAKAVLLDKRLAGPLVSLMEDEFKKAGMEFVAEDIKGEDEVLSVAKDAEYIISIFTKISRPTMEQLTNTKAIVRTGIGVDVLDVDAATDMGIKILNVPDYCFDEVATHAMAMLLTLERKLPHYNAETHNGIWNDKSGYTMRRLSALTLGIVSFGNIGRLFSTYARPYGIKMIAYDPYLPAEVFEEYGVEQVSSLDEIYARSDAISLHSPLTDETHHMINKDTIAKMKDGVILINVSRGGLINTQDLVDGVKAGKPLAAGLDVLEEEPLADASAPVYQVDNIIVSPHAAYASAEATPQLFIRTAQGLIGVEKNTGDYNCVNAKALAAKGK